MTKKPAGEAVRPAPFKGAIGGLRVFMALALCLASGMASAGNGVGQVFDQIGALAARSAAGQVRQLRPGAVVEVGDRLIVERGGQAQIEFHDGARFVMGPGADLGIRAYPLDPGSTGTRIIDLFDGAVKANLPDGLDATLNFQTNAAVIVGTNAAWTLFAEEEVTVVFAHRGAVQVQQLKVGGGPQGPLVQVTAAFAVVVPAAGPVGKPWKLGEVEREQVMQRLTPY